MKPRKNIALLTALPESAHGKRIITGISRQCEKYGYNLCVFGAMIYLRVQWENYKNGEANIFELANFNNLDGVILDTAMLIGDQSGETIRSICERLKENPGIPAVALELPIEGLPTIENHNENILREMCRHVIEFHGKKKICILTGPKENAAASSRLEVFLDEIGKHGLTVAPEHIIYGDFWYNSGHKLADDFVSGAVEMPEAVICSSDHMALGLIDKLTKNGVKIPDDLIVIGFDSTDEGASGKVSLSSYDANDACSAANAVDYIRRIIEPEAEILPYEEAAPSQMFHPAKSCGCEQEHLRYANTLMQALYYASRSATDIELMDQVDIGLLMESYVLENFTASKTPEECIRQIYDSTYLLNPFLNFYLCLTENWLDATKDRTRGYPEKIKMVISESTVTEACFFTEDQCIVFDTAQMLPKLSEESEKPSIFYFSPLHFSGNVLGYAVLQRDIHEALSLNLVYRTWLRFVNNALEMIRRKKSLQMLSVRDDMTGLYNRRGMYTELEKKLREADKDSSLFVCVIDMDGLKYINDTFGHVEGDFGIKIISSAISAIAQKNEICVRAGGDEFYLIGIGQYTQEDVQQRITTFNEMVEKMSQTYEKPYSVTASVGAVIRKTDSSLNIDEAVCEADERMYQHKVSRNKQRK